MKSTLVSLAGLVFVLVACGSQDGTSAYGPGDEDDRDVVAESHAATPDEPATLVGTYIVTEGEHAVDGAGAFEIHVVRENGLLNYQVRIRTTADERVTTTGPKHGTIDPNSNWFIHVESERRYWVFDGTSRVTLFEHTGTAKDSVTTMTDLASAPDRLLAEMPDGVKDRIPAAVLSE